MPQQFNFPSMVWKLLVGETPDRQDILFTDTTVYQLCKKLREHPEVTDDVFAETYEHLFFTVSNANEDEVDLIPDGSKTRVTFSTRQKFVDLTESFLLKEHTRPCNAASCCRQSHFQELCLTKH